MSTLIINEKIAEKYNTTPEEVRREMQIAIDAGSVSYTHLTLPTILLV